MCTLVSWTRLDFPSFPTPFNFLMYMCNLGTMVWSMRLCTLHHWYNTQCTCTSYSFKCGHQLQHTVWCTNKTSGTFTWIGLPLQYDCTTHNIIWGCSETLRPVCSLFRGTHVHVCTHSATNIPYTYMYIWSTHHSPCHVCWDLLLSQVTLSQCHDDHLHWHSGEQSSCTVMNSRVLMNM